MSAGAVRAVPAAEPRGAWAIVAGQELRDLWVTGRGLPLTLAWSVLLGVVGWSAASSQALNFLEQRESVGLLVQLTIGVGSLLALLAAADAVSGERERGTLETLLLAPVPRHHLAAGKLLASLTLWAGAFAISAPYVWVLARGVGQVGTALAAGLVAGSLLAVCAAALGLCISILSASNRVSLSVSLFLLIALFAPTQLPSSAQRGWLGDALLHVNPFTSAFRFVGRIVVDGRSWGVEWLWLASPCVGALLLGGAALALGARRLGLGGGGGR